MVLPADHPVLFANLPACAPAGVATPSVRLANGAEGEAWLFDGSRAVQVWAPG